jgi:hypothetical protein
MKPLRVEVNDKMQNGYVYYRTKPMGREIRLPCRTKRRRNAFSLLRRIVAVFRFSP